MKNFKNLLFFLILILWFFSGWPQIWPIGKLGVNTFRIPPKVQIAQAAPVTIYASSNSADGSLTGWTNPTYAYSDDGTNFATRAGSSKNTWYGTLYGFDLSAIPDGAVINSVTITAEWKNSANDSSGPVLYLGAKSGGAEVGSGTSDTSGTTSFEVATHAPTGLTAADLKATGANGFWAILRFRRTDNTTHTASVDYVKVVVDYTPNAAPTFSISQPDGTSDTVVVGQSYNITYDLSDSEDTATVDFYYDTNGSGLDGTAITGCQNQAEGTGATCSWDTTGMTPGDYYIYGIATDGVNSDVNDYSPGVITINAVVVSVSVSDGIITYGMTPANTSKTTLSGELNDMQTATNDGNVTETLNIKGQNGSGGGCTWTLAATNGSDQYVHQFCNATDNSCTSPPTNYTALTTSYQTLKTGVAVSGTVDFHLRLTTPNPSSCYNQQSIDITVQATQ